MNRLIKIFFLLILCLFFSSFSIVDNQRIIVFELLSEDVGLTNFQIESAQNIIASTIRDYASVSVVKKIVKIPEGEVFESKFLSKYVAFSLKGVSADACIYGYLKRNGEGFLLRLFLLDISGKELYKAETSFLDKMDVYSACVKATKKFCKSNISENSVEEKNEEEVLKFIPRDFVLVKGGSYLMGADYHKKSNMPEHSVDIKDFYISPYEVRLIEFDEFIADSSYQIEGGAFVYSVKKGFSKNSSVSWSKPLYDVYNNMPVTCVSWYDAVNYCNWKSKKEGLKECYIIKGDVVLWDRKANGYRLPTEAEWEYAASGGVEKRKYIFSGSDYAEKVAIFKKNSSDRPEICGAKSPNRLGLYDMSGNVWEWCWDFYSASYDDNVQEEYRVYRGGSWFSSQMNCLIINRMGNIPTMRANLLGFRLVKNCR